jgi:hypothetical protein
MKTAAALVALCVTLGNAGRVAATPAPGGLAGSWAFETGDGTSQRLVLHGQTYTVYVLGGGQTASDTASGRIDVDGDQITFYGGSRCPGSGTYQWTVAGGVLRFSARDSDPCPRSELLPSAAWTRP